VITDAKGRVHAAAVKLFGETIGCSDGGCVFGHPGGMHTNGGCQHLKERDVEELRRTVLRLSAVARELASAPAPGVARAPQCTWPSCDCGLRLPVRQGECPKQKRVADEPIRRVWGGEWVHAKHKCAWCGEQMLVRLADRKQRCENGCASGLGQCPDQFLPDPERLPIGAHVLTLRDAGSTDWSKGKRNGVRWGVEGTVVAVHDSHGLVYDVKHDDGTTAPYEPAEIQRFCDACARGRGADYIHHCDKYGRQLGEAPTVILEGVDDDGNRLRLVDCGRYPMAGMTCQHERGVDEHGRCRLCGESP